VIGDELDAAEENDEIDIVTGIHDDGQEALHSDQIGAHVVQRSVDIMYWVVL